MGAHNYEQNKQKFYLCPMGPPTLSCTYTYQRNCMTSPHEPSGNLKKKHIWLRYELTVKTLFLLKKVWQCFLPNLIVLFSSFLILATDLVCFLFHSPETNFDPVSCRSEPVWPYFRSLAPFWISTASYSQTESSTWKLVHNWKVQ